MAEIVLFHHAQGLTRGVLDLAGTLRQAGHRVHTPDVFDGRVFDTLDEGIGYLQQVRSGAVRERSLRAVAELPVELVYLGMSVGVVPAQQLAQTRPGARGALLLYSCLPVTEFGPAWPQGVPVQVHAAERDPFFVDDGDLDAARALVASTPDAELFLYPGEAHLFADGSLPSYDEAATASLTERVLAFLRDV